MVRRFARGVVVSALCVTSACDEHSERDAGSREGGAPEGGTHADAAGDAAPSLDGPSPRDAAAADADPGAPDAASDGKAPRDAGADSAVPDGAVESGPPDAGPVAYEWRLPPGFPEPEVPDANPMTREKVELGRYLFYDGRLSDNETQACAGCHVQSLAFTDGLPQAVGSTGVSHPRNSMSLQNVAYNATLTWGHPFMFFLEDQALVPMFGSDPVELGLRSYGQLEERLAGVPLYRTLFSAAFPGEDEPITVRNVTLALASFQRTIISGRSPFDRYLQLSDDSGMSDAAKRGYQHFSSEKFECFHCHVGFNLSDQTHWKDKAFFSTPFHNTGLYNVDGRGAYPEPNTGIHNVTGKAADMGKFRAPSLRNIAVTAPYMHDGSIATLEEVLDHYQAGGRTIASGPYAGNGSASPLQDPLIRPVAMTPEERADVIAFFETLTDTEFLTDPALSNPWLQDQRDQ
jgi:cytochrome c peroxidase